MTIHLSLHPPLALPCYLSFVVPQFLCRSHQSLACLPACLPAVATKPYTHIWKSPTGPARPQPGVCRFLVYLSSHPPGGVGEDADATLSAY